MFGKKKDSNLEKFLQRSCL